MPENKQNKKRTNNIKISIFQTFQVIPKASIFLKKNTRNLQKISFRSENSKNI